MPVDLSHITDTSKLITAIKNIKNIDFINRLKDPNREFIQDWVDPLSIATHKMGWSDDGVYGYVYPSVQKDKKTGKLIDYTRPPYSLDAAKQESMKTGEEIKMKKDLAKWFTENYKKYFPGFKGE